VKKKELKKKIKNLEAQVSDKRNDFNLKIREYAGREFDRLIVILSSGGLALTISYIEIFKDNLNPEFKHLVIISWVLLFLALVLILSSHLTSMKSIDKELEENDQVSDYYNIATNILNISSFVFLISGVLAFLIFILKTF
jgi:hypothetical protein